MHAKILRFYIIKIYNKYYFIVDGDMVFQNRLLDAVKSLKGKLEN